MCRLGLCSVILLFGLGSLASADVLVSDSFDYDAGPIDNQDGGEGWFEPWVIADPFFESDFKLDVVAPEKPLVYALPEGGFVNGGDRALRFANDDPEAVVANEVMALTRGIDEVITADEVFFSFLYRYDGDGTETGGFIDDNDFVVWWFNSAAGPQMGLKGNFGDGSSTEDFVGRVSGAFAPPQQAYVPGIDISEEAGTLNSDWLVVGKMSKAQHSEEADDYDQFDLWINPGLGDEDSPQATGLGAPEDSLAFDLQTLGLRVFNQEPGDAMIWDELRIGETWEDVVGPLGDQNIDIGVVGDCNGDDVLDIQDANCTPDGELDALLASLSPPSLRGDADGDGMVQFTDLVLLSDNFGGPGNYTDADFDKDGTVQFGDLVILSDNFGMTAGGAVAASVPEPSGVILLVSAICCGFVVRRRRS